MSKGILATHAALKAELKNYITAQYLSKSPVLLEALDEELDTEGFLYREPYIESSPAYKSLSNGIGQTLLPDWMKKFFSSLAAAHLGVYAAPFLHQVRALENWRQGKDLFVSTGTGSGKTECFLWPILAKMVQEAHDRPADWKQRGVRCIIMYPMNALVSDQISRLRRLLGDPEGNFLRINFMVFSINECRFYTDNLVAC